MGHSFLQKTPREAAHPAHNLPCRWLEHPEGVRLQLSPRDRKRGASGREQLSPRLGGGV